MWANRGYKVQPEGGKKLKKVGSTRNTIHFNTGIGEEKFTHVPQQATIVVRKPKSMKPSSMNLA
jgi:hypothetical protein